MHCLINCVFNVLHFEEYQQKSQNGMSMGSNGCSRGNTVNNSSSVHHYQCIINCILQCLNISAPASIEKGFHRVTESVENTLNIVRLFNTQNVRLSQFVKCFICVLFFKIFPYDGPGANIDVEVF